MREFERPLRSTRQRHGVRQSSSPLALSPADSPATAPHHPTLCFRPSFDPLPPALELPTNPHTMKLFGLNISRLPATAQLQPETKSLSPAAQAWLKGEDVDTGAPLLSNAYQQVVWVYRAINVLAEQVANIPFRFSLGEAGGEQLIESGPLTSFYARPHPQINRFEYWELRVIWLMLRGECFRIPIFDERGTRDAQRSLRSLLILDPADFQHIVEDHQLIGWLYTGIGRETPLEHRVFLPEEVWFEKLPDPFNFWRGMAPLQAAALASKTDYAAGAFMKGLMENNGDVGVIVRTQDTLSPDQRQQILDSLRDRKRKAGTADRPLLLGQGAEIVKPTLSSSDMQFLENRKFSRGEICAAFGVPEEIVTTTDTAKYNVMAGARLNFIENRVLPLCRRLEAEEDVVVKSLDPRAVGWFDIDSLPILQQARRERLKTAKTGFDMGVPFNELNRVFDLGFKALPWGDRGYIPASLQQAGELPTATEPGTSSSPAPYASAQTPALSSITAPGPLSPSPADSSPFERLLALLASPGAPTLPRPLASKIHRYFFEQRRRVLAAINSKLSNAPSAPDLQALLSEILNQLFETENQRLLPDRIEARREPRGQVDLAIFSMNHEIHAAIQSALAECLGPDGAFASLPDRIRAIYNNAARRNSVNLCHTPSAIDHTPSAIGHMPSAICLSTNDANPTQPS